MVYQIGGRWMRARSTVFCGAVFAGALLAGVAGGDSLSRGLVGTAHAGLPTQTFELDINSAPGVRTSAAVLSAHGVLALDDRAKVSAPITNLGHGSTTLGVAANARDVYTEAN